MNLVDLRFQGKKAERAKRDMAGSSCADGIADKLIGRQANVASHKSPLSSIHRGQSPSPRPNPSTLDLTIALLTGIIVVGVSV